MNKNYVWINLHDCKRGAWLQAVPNLYRVVYLHKCDSNYPNRGIFVANRNLKKGQVVTRDDIHKLKG